MAEAKKYYWLRLQHDFFNSKRIKKLRSMENGSDYVIIYQKMQLKSIKDNGLLSFIGLERTFEEEIALDIDEDPEKVKATVEFLLKYGMLEKIDSDRYLLPYTQGNVGSETSAASRMRELRRAKGQQEECVEQKQNKVQQSSTDKEQPEDIKPVPESIKKKSESMTDLFNRLREEIPMSPILDEKVRLWLKYKSERKERYKETGLRSLMKQVNKNSEEYGENAVCDLIDKCMSSNWAGIIFERLEKSNAPSRSERIANRVNDVRNWV